jgi:hypothetical protein
MEVLSEALQELGLLKSAGGAMVLQLLQDHDAEDRLLRLQVSAQAKALV